MFAVVVSVSVAVIVFVVVVVAAVAVVVVAAAVAVVKGDFCPFRSKETAIQKSRSNRRMRHIKSVD